MSKCVDCVFDENLTLDRMMMEYVSFLCLLYGTFKLLKERKQLMDEVTKLKEEIQIKSSEKQQVKADEKAPDTREPQPRKDLVRDQAVTNCVEVGQTDEVTKETEKPKQGSKSKVTDAAALQEKKKAKDAASLQEKKQKSLERWKYCLGFAEKGYKHPYKNLFCAATKFNTFYVGNLSFKANSKDIQQSFQKQLSMKVDSVCYSKGKSSGCAFITMRWKEFHDSNQGYNSDQETTPQKKLWADFLVNIMNEEDICGCKMPRSMSSLLAVRDAAKAFCAFVAGDASWPATESRLVRAVDLRVCVKSIILWYQVPHLRVLQVLSTQVLVELWTILWLAPGKRLFRVSE